VNDWNPRQACRVTSKDGIKDWTFRDLVCDPTKPFLRDTDGTVNHWDKIERPGVLLQKQVVLTVTS